MVWQPSVKMKKTNSSGIEEVVVFNRFEIGRRKAEGWVEIGGDDHPTKIDSDAVKKLQDDGGNGSDVLTPAQMVAAKQVADEKLIKDTELQLQADTIAAQQAGITVEEYVAKRKVETETIS